MRGIIGGRKVGRKAWEIARDVITYLKLLKAIGAQMPPAGAIMTAAEDDNLGKASK
jgi:hypothetical protein